MNSMRERAKEHFPTVLLTLLSIVQALALELLWSHLGEADYLFEVSWIAVISWIQVAATFLGLEQLGQWFVLMAVLVGIMNWIAHMMMRRARQDSDNEAFFRDVVPARLRDFYPQLATVGALAGAYLLMTGDRGAFAIVALLATGALLAWQFYVAAMFWENSLAED